MSEPNFSELSLRLFQDKEVDPALHGEIRRISPQQAIKEIGNAALEIDKRVYALACSLGIDMDLNPFVQIVRLTPNLKISSSSNEHTGDSSFSTTAIQGNLTYTSRLDGYSVGLDKPRQRKYVMDALNGNVFYPSFSIENEQYESLYLDMYGKPRDQSPTVDFMHYKPKPGIALDNYRFSSANTDNQKITLAPGHALQIAHIVFTAINAEIEKAEQTGLTAHLAIGTN